MMNLIKLTHENLFKQLTVTVKMDPNAQMECVWTINVIVTMVLVDVTAKFLMKMSVNTDLVMFLRIARTLWEVLHVPVSRDI